mmetsp:Transcript_82796/g.208907  ORF Transcript_82796/g.208907 Transcript_82796/m.208907 type:complete len:209 (+) Transcript_82796:205-831(+)
MPSIKTIQTSPSCPPSVVLACLSEVWTGTFAHHRKTVVMIIAMTRVAREAAVESFTIMKLQSARQRRLLGLTCATSTQAPSYGPDLTTWVNLGDGRRQPSVEGRLPMSRASRRSLDGGYAVGGFPTSPRPTTVALCCGMVPRSRKLPQRSTLSRVGSRCQGPRRGRCTCIQTPLMLGCGSTASLSATASLFRFSGLPPFPKSRSSEAI